VIGHNATNFEQAADGADNPILCGKEALLDAVGFRALGNPFVKQKRHGCICS